MNKIALRAGKSPFSRLTHQETALRGVSATNVGNMIFSEAAFKTLSAPDVDVIPLGYDIHKVDPQRINEHFDAVVLPFANAFRLEWKDQLISYTRFVQKLKIPVIIMGIGIQTDFEYNLDYLNPIAKEAKALISAVLDRSSSIGVRGEASKNFIKSLGFSEETIDVIGCPSMFRYGRHFHLNINKLEKSADDSDYALNMTLCRSHDQRVKRGGQTLLNFIHYNIARYDTSDLVLQANYSLITMLWGRKVGKMLEYDGLPLISTQKLDKGRGKQFVDPRTWIEFLSKKDFVIGSRIHGNITGLLAGTPSFVLAHDSRTREICEYFHIPFQRLSDVGNHLDIEKFKQKSDYSKFISNYTEKFDTYLYFLKKNGLKNYFDSPITIDYFDEKLRDCDFPGPAAGVNSNELLKYSYWIEKSIEKAKKIFTNPIENQNAELF